MLTIAFNNAQIPKRKSSFIGATSFRIMTLRIMTLSMKGVFAILTITTRTS
jgi:hypothetical protein